MKDQAMLPFINPATGEQFGEIKMATPADVVRAHKEMRENLPRWRHMKPATRARILKKLQKVLIEYADEISAVVNQDTGKSRQDALSEVFLVVDKLHNYCKHAPGWLRRERIPPGVYFFKRYYAEPQPFGVVAVIGPWNLPLDLTIPPVVSALLAGNTVLLKPSEVTAATGVLIEKLFQSVPELSPYVRVLHGDGSVGAELVASKPDLIFLTGSTGTGRKVAQAAAETLTPFISELGGKDPMIVLEDANIGEAARWGAWGSFYHSGQTCVAVERIYVVEEVYDQFVELFVRETKKIKHGYSADLMNNNDIGPLTFERQLSIVQDHLQDAVSKGARIVHGGRHDGLFFEPTVVVNVDHSMKLMREETFGPVAAVMCVRDEAEAIEMANDSTYGLSACVWTGNLERGARVGTELEAGSVLVNDTIAHYAVPLLPFGGVKQSGTARTHGRQDVLQFTQTRAYGVGGTPFAMDVATVLRKPRHYHLMSAIMHLFFGVTPQQRLRAVKELGLQVQKTTPVPQRTGRIALGTGAAVALMALVFSLLRFNRED